MQAFVVILLSEAYRCSPTHRHAALRWLSGTQATSLRPKERRVGRTVARRSSPGAERRISSNEKSSHPRQDFPPTAALLFACMLHAVIFQFCTKHDIGATTLPAADGITVTERVSGEDNIFDCQVAFVLLFNEDQHLVLQRDLSGLHIWQKARRSFNLPFPRMLVRLTDVRRAGCEVA